MAAPAKKPASPEPLHCSCPASFAGLPGLTAAPPCRAPGRALSSLTSLVTKMHSLFRRVAHFLASAGHKVAQGEMRAHGSAASAVQGMGTQEGSFDLLAFSRELLRNRTWVSQGPELPKAAGILWEVKHGQRPCRPCLFFVWPVTDLSLPPSFSPEVHNL